ncbi:MAG: hypothetical protein UEY11_07825, partial [Evtepia gabavorous]|nr:hypothetical protein [Evtepia gabavorous]
ERKRAKELDVIIKKLYESFAVGRISEERFDNLLAEYEKEQKQLLSSVESAEHQLSAFEEDTVRMEQFLSLAKELSASQQGRYYHHTENVQEQPHHSYP